MYETSGGRNPYSDWFDRLDGTLRRAVQRRLRAIEDNDHFGKRKNLRGGLQELKFRQVIRIYEIPKARARLKDFEQRTK